jgi:hypothetical protein
MTEAQASRALDRAVDLLRIGGVAGVFGTLAMSALMLAAGRTGRMGTQPPRRVVDAAAERLPVEASRGPVRDVAAAALHLAVGATAGMVELGMLRAAGRAFGTRVPGSALGAGLGLALWAIAYGAVAPALHILPPPSDDRSARPAVMVAAHLVYGITTALALEALGRRWGPGGERTLARRPAPRRSARGRARP